MNVFLKKFSSCVLALSVVIFAPGQAAAKIGMSVTPKIWASVENYNAFETSLLTNTGASRQISIREQVNIPLYGVAVGFRPGDAPFDMLLNFYGGSTTGKFLLAEAAGFRLDGNYELKRTDLEFLIRWLPKDKLWNLFTGLRVNSFEDTQTITTAGGTWNASGTNKLITQTTIVLWEVGAGFFTPINEAGTQRFFGNTTIGFGSFESEFENGTTALRKNTKTGAAAAWDVNTGYEIFLGESFSLSARYRLYAKPTSPMNDGYNLTVIHGPDFGATVRF